MLNFNFFFYSTSIFTCNISNFVVNISSCIEPNITNVILSKVKLLHFTLMLSLRYTLIKWNFCKIPKHILPISDISFNENST